MVLETGRSKIQVLRDSVSGEIPFPGSLCPHMAEEGRDLSGVPFIRTLIPFKGDLSS